MDSVLADTLKANLKNAATEDAKLDTVNRKVYRNAGTGAFTYGNDLKYEALNPSGGGISAYA